MPKFTTRVELHNSEDYEKLHTAMKNEGFSRTIKWDGDDNTYQLPTAEYTCGGNELTKDGVLAAARKAATTVTKEYSVLVTQADGSRRQYGLKVVKPPAKVIFKKS